MGMQKQFELLEVRVIGESVSLNAHSILRKLCPNEQILVANILKSKYPFTLILSMYKWYNTLNKYGPEEPGRSYGHFSGNCGAFNLKLSQVTNEICFFFLMLPKIISP